MACRAVACGGLMACGERMTCRVGYGLPRWSAVRRAYDLLCGGYMTWRGVASGGHMACRGGLLCGGYMICRAVACGERMTCRVGYGLPRWSAVQRAYDLPCGVWPVAVACCAASV